MLLADHTIVYGGSFDPPHMSHQMSCLYLLEALAAEHIWLVPTSTHPFGKALTEFSTRFAMCKLMAEPFGDQVSVLSIERDMGGAGRTIDTLISLRARFPERKLALAIGSDIVADAPRWHRWADIEAMVPVVVVGRAGYPHAQTPLELPGLASHAVRNRLRRGESIEGLVPARVARYIKEQDVYGPADTGTD